MGDLQGVKHVNASQSDGWCLLEIESNSNRDVRDDLSALASKKGWPLRELRREVATLEDFFVQITAQQQAKQGARKGKR